MVIIFYTSRTLPFCRAVKMLITHLNLPFNEVYVQPFTDTRSDEFKKINPYHTLPTIDDHGFILWESRAIMQYLCNKYAPDSGLYPKEPQHRAIVDRLLNFDLKLSATALAAHFEFTFPNEYSASRHDLMITLTDSLTFLEIFLIGHDYVGGESLTIADLSILASVTFLEIAVQFEISSYPNIWGWINRMRRELPYYDQLTKQAHDELREIVKSIREAHEEWSCSTYCCFKECTKHPLLNGDCFSNNCIELSENSSVNSPVSVIEEKYDYSNYSNYYNYNSEESQMIIDELNKMVTSDEI